MPTQGGHCRPQLSGELALFWIAAGKEAEGQLAALYFFAGRQLLFLFMNEPTGTAIDTGILFLRIVAPFYFLVSVKLVSDGVLRGCALMIQFMISTFADLILRVALAVGLSATALGSDGIWLSWPIGWTVGTALSLFFCLRAIGKARNTAAAADPASADAAGALAGEKA